MAMPTTGPENTVALWGRDVKGEAQKPRWPERQGLWEGVGVCNWPGQSPPHWLSLGVLRHQLGTVVGQTRQQMGPAPVEEVV